MNESLDIEAIRHGFKTDLRGMDLREANLRAANLREANLRDTLLQGADLRSADLWYADLQDAHLQYADLRDADLQDADLREAEFAGADLQRAFLGGANLLDADFTGATIWRAVLPAYEQIPSDGSFIAYKYTTEYLVRLEVPADAERTSCLANRKCRAERARVTDILAKDGSECEAETAESYHREFTYREGEMAEADEWNPDIRVECTHGIHFYPSKRLAQRNGVWDVSGDGGHL